MVTKKRAQTATANREPRTRPEIGRHLDALIDEDSKQLSATPDQLAQITTAAHALQRAFERQKSLEEQLAEANAEVKRLELTVLPTLLDEAGTRVIGLDDGYTLERTEQVFASIAAANALSAARWLEKHGFGALVKTRYTIPLDKGDSERAARIRSILAKAKIVFEEKTGVHSATLTAFVKESLAEGRVLPKAITYHVQPRVVMKQSKKR